MLLWLSDTLGTAAHTVKLLIISLRSTVFRITVFGWVGSTNMDPCPSLPHSPLPQLVRISDWYLIHTLPHHVADIWCSTASRSQLIAGHIDLSGLMNWDVSLRRSSTVPTATFWKCCACRGDG